MKLLTFSRDAACSSRLGAGIGGDTIIDMALAHEQCWGARAPDWFGSVAELLKGGDRAMGLARDLLKQVETKPDRYRAC